MKYGYQQLLHKIIILEENNKQLQENNEQLQENNEQFKISIENRNKTIVKLQEVVKLLQKQLDKMRSELQKYHNENTPSGSIPPYLKELEKNVKNITKDNDKKNQSPKSNTRNSRSEHIDRKEYHELEDTKCKYCGGELTKKKVTRKRIVIEMPLPSPEIVEHELALYYCKKCGVQKSAEVSNALPKMKFDMNTVIFISYLNIALNMPMRGIVDILRDIFHISVSKATVSNTLIRLKDYLGDYYLELEKKVKSAGVRYKDETSVRYNGKTFWMWVASTGKGIIYRIDKSRSSKVAKEMGSKPNSKKRNSKKPNVDECDGYSVYNKLNTELQRCWAHLLKRLRKPIYDFGDEENYGEYQKFVLKLCKLFSNAKSEKRKFGASKYLREKYEKLLWDLLNSIENKRGKNMVRATNYIIKYFNDLFTFLKYEEVNPTNNEAERALRHFVVKRKISQQFRAKESIQSYERQLGLYMTSQLKEQSYLKNLGKIIDGKMNTRQ